ncbi:MAG: nucleotidyltransferase domain-containing protein [Oligoflexia bacterium]|nr:nucleotidyltransferase domain-containing protein [Oligoflexia bacterium]MBF0364605.1 nucleotidyltransferase domain-containing protein [Oligoflexia bacterium]
MRLSNEEKKAIIESIQQFDPSAKIYLFGSRVDDHQKGGDIDIFVISELLTFHQKIEILVILEQKIGEQKIDLLIKTSKDAKEDLFVKTFLKKAILLSMV